MICKNCGKKVYAKEICDCGEKAPNVHGKGVAVNSVICTIILVLSVIAFILSVSLRNIVNENIIVETIRYTDLCELEVNDDGKKVKLDEYINEEFIGDERITVQNVDNILNAPFIKDFIIEKVEGYQDFFMDRGEMEVITANDIVELIDKNSQLLYNEAGLEFLEPDKENLRNELEVLDDFSNFCNDYLTGWLTGGLIQTYFSLYFVNFLEILFVIILVQWLLVYRFNGRRMSKALEKYSIAVMVPSGILFVLSMLLFIPDKNSILGAFTMYIRSTFIISSGIVLGAGIILNIISTLTSKKKNVKSETVLSEENALIQIKTENKSDEVIANESFAPVSTTPAVQAEQPKNVFCTQCGNKNRENSSFCSKCGNKLI